VSAVTFARGSQIGPTSAATDNSGSHSSWWASTTRRGSTPRALTQVDGIDIYESVRLESEGITDIPTLATADLVSMMVDTRLPVERLVDWSDQAVLMMFLPEPDDTHDGAGDDDDSEPAGGEAGKPTSRIEALQQVGIRTASSVLAAACASKDSGLHKQATGVLGEDLLDSLAQQIANEPSTQRICHWREAEREDLCEKRPLIKPSRPATTVRSGRTRAYDIAAMAFARGTAALADDRLVIIDLTDDPDRQAP